MVEINEICYEDNISMGYKVIFIIFRNNGWYIVKDKKIYKEIR